MGITRHCEWVGKRREALPWEYEDDKVSAHGSGTQRSRGGGESSPGLSRKQMAR